MKSGFTLIELSIVLVIIGLLAGGVLAGRHLIEIAEVNRAVGDIQKLKTALTTFKLKYNCLAGDCKTATAHGVGVNGDGDDQYGGGQGGGGYNPYQNEGRIVLWEHLHKSHLMELGLSQPGVYGSKLAKGVNIPDWPWLRNTRGVGRNQIADLYLRTGNPCNWWGTNGCEEYQVWVTDNWLTSNTIVIGGLWDDGSKLMTVPGSPLNSEFAGALDAKLDDGLPLTGTVWGKLSIGSGWGTSEGASCANGVDDPSQPYRSGYTCMLFIAP